MSDIQGISAITQFLDAVDTGQTREEKIEQLKHAVDFYKNQMMIATTAGIKPMGLMAGYGLAMDRVTAKKNAEFAKDGMMPSCRKGCSHCCHYYVSCTDIEAKAIIEYCEKSNVLIEPQYLEKQARFDEEGFKTQPNRTCQFLSKDGMCNIYPVRPLNCRKYYVTTDPELCDTYKNPGAKVGSILNIEAECMVVAVYNDEEQSLPQAILKNLKH